MITFVCFKWNQSGYRSKFTAEHVNTLYSMLQRYAKGCRLLCITDDAVGIHPNVLTMPLYDDHAGLPNASWAGGPSCYRRLGVFAKDFPWPVGTTRVVCLDLDIVILRDLSPILDQMLFSGSLDRLFMWGTGELHVPVCGSMFGFHVKGALDHVWTSFKGEKSAREAVKTMPGSDQAWMAHCVGIANIVKWNQSDGVYSFGHDLCYDNGRAFAKSRIKVKPPTNARIVIFNGKPDPWECLHLPWVKEHYR